MTPLAAIAPISRLITQKVDLLTGDRSLVPWMVALGCQIALKKLNISSDIFYGKSAWIEVLDNHQIAWTGYWGENIYFWLVTQFQETVDLNAGVSFRQRSSFHPQYQALYSPPLLWSVEIPRFYLYQPEGIADCDPVEEKEKRQLEELYHFIDTRFIYDQGSSTEDDLKEDDFPNEPILCHGRRILDDSKKTFASFDRAISIQGIPRFSGFI